MPITAAQVRVIDPILSTVAQGYRNSDLVGSVLFPEVPVAVSGGQVIEFGREAFRRYNARRVPGGTTKRIDFGYLGKPFALVQDALEGKVPREWLRDAARVPGIDLGSRAINTVMKALRLGLEYEQAQLATTPGNYDSNHKITLSGASKWSDSSNPDPLVNIDAGREAIRASCGVYPNVLLLSASAFNALKNNAKVVSRFQYTGRDSITPEMIANLYNVERVVVGKAVTFSDADAASDIWGNNAVLAYTNLGSLNAEEPSYGYTYLMEGHPAVEQAYYDNSAKSWIYPVTIERLAVLSGITAGYLIQTPA